MFAHADRSKNEQFETSQALRWVDPNFRSPLPNAYRAHNHSKRKFGCPVPRDQPPLTFGYSSAALSHATVCVGHARLMLQPINLFPAEDDSVPNQRGMKNVETIKSQDSLWLLRCKNEKCRAFFDYFGPLCPASVNCTHCGKRHQYAVADFEKHESEE